MSELVPTGRKSQRMLFGEAIDFALGEEMARDRRVLMWGEDTELLHRDLLARFGPQRIRDTPISEMAFAYAGVGAAMTGLRPVVEIMMVDFMACAWSALSNAASKFTDFSGGDWRLPMVFRVGVGGWYSDGGQHSQAMWGQLAAYPGVSVVCPSTPADAAGLMVSAVRADHPVVYLESKLLSEQWLDYLGGSSRSTVDFASVVPAGGAAGSVAMPISPVELGSAAIRRPGRDVTLVSLGVGVHRCLEAASVLAGEGIDAEVIDLRSVAPLDRETVLASVGRTGRVVVADEDYRQGGLSGEIAAVLLEGGLRPAYARVCVEHTIPFNPAEERAALPNPERIAAAVRGLA